MKTRPYFLLFLLFVAPLTFLSSCNKIKELTAVPVTMNLQRQHFTYSPTLLKSNEVILYAAKITINLDSLLSANGLSSSTIPTATFTNIAVTMERPADSTFHWLSSMRATVADNQAFNPEYTVGSVINTNPLAKTVIVTLNDVNIRPYLSQTGFYLRIYAVLNGPLPALTVGMFLDGTILLTIQPV